jgi:hypothetical protein
MATRDGAIDHDPREGLMTELIDRLVAAMNAHELDAAPGSSTSTTAASNRHPRAFVGRAQMRANWEAMFAGIPDFQRRIGP